MVPKRLYILVVDDLADLADCTAEMLTFWGYDATACSSGAAALACAEARRPAAVLLDVFMPRMSGFEFVRAFRALDGCAAVPIVMVSGTASPEYVARARAAEISYYLLKPVAPTVLENLLSALTRQAPAPSPRVGTCRDARRHSAPALV